MSVENTSEIQGTRGSSLPARKLDNRLLLVVGAIVVLVALAARTVFFDYESLDYFAFLRRWYDHIAANGGFQALRDPSFSDYNIPYLYLLAVLTYLPIPPLIGIKLISVVFDLILGFFVYRMVSLRYPNSWIPLLAGSIVLFLPTIVLNSSMWAQADAIYAAFSVGGVYYLMRQRPWLACAFFGLALSFKLQAIFLFPLLLLLVLRKQIPWRALLLIPGTYLAMDVPALLLGASPKALLNVYLSQVGSYSSLTLNAPNVYQYLSVDTSDALRYTGIAVTAVLIVALAMPVVLRRITMTPSRILLAATVLAVLVPYFLPAMHERYFYLADVLTVVAACYLPRALWALPVLVQFASAFSYAVFLRIPSLSGAGQGFPQGLRPPSSDLPVGPSPSGLPTGTPPGGMSGMPFGQSTELVSFPILASAMLAALVLVTWTAVREFRRPQTDDFLI